MKRIKEIQSYKRKMLGTKAKRRKELSLFLFCVNIIIFYIVKNFIVSTKRFKNDYNLCKLHVFIVVTCETQTLNADKKKNIVFPKN